MEFTNKRIMAIIGGFLKNPSFKIAMLGRAWVRLASDIGHCLRFTFWLTLKKPPIMPLGIFSCF